MNYIKAKNLKNKTTDDSFLIEYKIDGVRVLYQDGYCVSRANKPYPGLTNLSPDVLSKLTKHKDCEFFYKDWNTSVSIARSHEHDVDITPDMFYSLTELDTRLLRRITSPGVLTLADVEDDLQHALALGYEGIMVKSVTNPVWYRVKPKLTADLIVRDVQPGTGKHTGKMGALYTDMGKVGTGFTDVDRELNDWLGTLIEVEYTELTINNQMRHPRYLRRRTDKETQSYE